MYKRVIIRRIEGLLRFLPDDIYLKMKYRYKMKKKLNLDSPKTYNEKLQWLKLYDKNDLYTKLVDKYEVKSIIATIIGEEYIIPTIGCWNKFDEIKFEELPSEFVLKCTHDSGGLCICRKISEFDLRNAKKIITNSLNHNFFWSGREWPYKNVVPRIIAEPFIEDAEQKELRDYKFFVFEGVVRLLFVATNRNIANKETCFDFFDSNFKHIKLENGHPCSTENIEKPQNFQLMKDISEKIANILKLKQVRVDLYEANGKVYFGELTFFHHSGFTKFQPDEWDIKMGEWIKL